MSGIDLDRYSGSHAVLFYGSEGSGPEDAAVGLAQKWLCPQGGCGECAVCRAFETRRCVDFMHVAPWGPSSLIKVGAVHPPARNKRDEDAPDPTILEFLRMRPLMARSKVVWIERADRMNADAANALLKTLEEPPDYARLVLTTAEFGRLLPTIRSRCLNVAMTSQPPSDDPMLRAFGPTPGLLARVESHRELYEKLWSLLESSLDAPFGAAIALSERCRGIGESLASAQKSNARVANTEVTRCVAAWLLHRRPDDPERAQAAVEAHRLIVGNANPGLVFDRLWTAVLRP
ncbi:MAG: hypothetical protein JST30_07005 [Armatimonadetes bacterium]|nr:hypothetical protein [Armatimonadota bacterium]